MRWSGRRAEQPHAMHEHPTDFPRARPLAERAFSALHAFLRIEALSGVVLLSAASIALIWANSPLAHHYHALLNTPLSITLGRFALAQSLHFWINDGLLTFFFLVVGMEIRREMHEGTLSSLSQAMLPIAAAIGGVLVPALIYLALNIDSNHRQGWAVPTATDIAFAVGVLALLGRSIPGSVRIFLLALAIIDDIIAVLIIAFFYSGGLDYAGLLITCIGVFMVLSFHRMGIGSAYGYVVPGAVVWIGLLKAGIHPTLSGVVLGLMTPVRLGMGERPLDTVSRVASDLQRREIESTKSAVHLMQPLRQLRLAQRDLLPPVVRVQMALHPWVAYGIMPLFALANAGVSLSKFDPTAEGALTVLIGIVVALVVGKPLGIISVSWLMVRLNWCRLPPGMFWDSLCLVGLLAGIGFTMSIFIAMLAFTDENTLSAAKLGVLLGSLIASALGLGWGVAYARTHRKNDASEGSERT